MPAQLEAGYDDAYTAGSEAERKNRRLAPDYARKIRPYLPLSGFRFLDVGGSHGWLAQLIRDEYHASVLLLEPGRSAVAAAQARRLNAQAGFLEDFVSPEPFDVVCAAHVIEHVADPYSFLASLARVLRPGGILLLLTPNAESWKLAWFGKHWGWAVPEQHALFLSSESARRLLSQQGLESVAVRACRPAFAHYPYFAPRALARWRAQYPEKIRRALGIFTRAIAISEYLVLSLLDLVMGMKRADELLIVARKP